MVARNILYGTTLVLLSGCLPPLPAEYRYDGRVYFERSAAYMAYSAHFRDLVNQTEPLKKPITGPVKIVVPNATAIRKVMVADTGDARTRDYRAGLLADSYEVMAQSVVRRNIFSVAKIEWKSELEHLEPQPDAAILYVAPVGQGATWYFLSDSVPRTRVPASHLNRSMEEVNRYFVDQVERIVSTNAAKQ